MRRFTRRTGKSLFVKLSQLGSTAIERTPRRTAVRRSGTSAKIRPGLDVTSRAGRYLSNDRLPAHGKTMQMHVNQPIERLHRKPGAGQHIGYARFVGVQTVGQPTHAEPLARRTGYKRHRAPAQPALPRARDRK